ncbi:MAG: hypothetical protein ACFFBP_17535 [Promethearchaeota archaeon]
MSKNDIEFNKNALDESEKYYKLLHLSSDQRRKIRLVSKLATNFIPISEYAMAGFAYRAIQEYQVDNKIEMIQFETMSASDKLKMFSNLLERIRKMLLKAIVTPDQTDLLDKAVKEAYEFYKHNLI